MGRTKNLLEETGMNYLDIAEAYEMQYSAEPYKCRECEEVLFEEQDYCEECYSHEVACKLNDAIESLKTTDRESYLLLSNAIDNAEFKQY